MHLSIIHVFVVTFFTGWETKWSETKDFDDYCIILAWMSVLQSNCLIIIQFYISYQTQGEKSSINLTSNRSVKRLTPLLYNLTLERTEHHGYVVTALNIHRGSFLLMLISLFTNNLPWCFPGPGACCVRSHTASGSSLWPLPPPSQWADPGGLSSPDPVPEAWSLAPDTPCPDPCSVDPDSECRSGRPCTERDSEDTRGSGYKRLIFTVVSEWTEPLVLTLGFETAWSTLRGQVT